MATREQKAGLAANGQVRLVRRTRRERIDRNRLWWTAFIAGTALVCVAAFVPVPYFYIVGLILPLGVMVAYAYMGWKYTAGTPAHAPFADSVYYLGFLFTLVTLALTLIYLALSESWEEVPLAELIGRFGLALSTTILGLAVRVAWVNLKDPGTGRENAEQALFRAAENFRIQLEESTEAFSSLSHTYSEELEKAVVATSTSLAEQASASSKQINEVMTECKIALERSAKGLRQAVEECRGRLALPDEWIKEAIQRPIAGITETLDQLREQLGDSVTAQRKMVKEAERLAKSYSEASEDIKPMTELFTRSGDVVEKFERAADVVSRFANGFEARLSDAARRIQELEAAISTLQGSMSRFSDGLLVAGESSKQLSEIATVAEKHKTSLEASLVASRKAVSSLHDELVEAARTVVAKLK